MPPSRTQVQSIPSASLAWAPSMRRRECIALLGVTVVGSVPAFAQQPTGVRQVALLSSFNENSAEVQVYIAALREGLAKLGWEEGRNIHIEFRWAGSDAELTRRLAKEVVGLRPDLLSRPTHPRPRRCYSLRAQSRSCFPISLIRSAKDLPLHWRGRVAMRPAWSISNPRWRASGSSSLENSCRP